MIECRDPGGFPAGAEQHAYAMRVRRARVWQVAVVAQQAVRPFDAAVYAAEGDAFVVQGWIVTDPKVLAAVTLADDETVVEVPAKLLCYLEKAGIVGVV